MNTQIMQQIQTILRQGYECLEQLKQQHSQLDQELAYFLEEQECQIQGLCCEQQQQKKELLERQKHQALLDGKQDHELQQLLMEQDRKMDLFRLEKDQQTQIILRKLHQIELLQQKIEQFVHSIQLDLHNLKETPSIQPKQIPLILKQIDVIQDNLINELLNE